MSTANTAGGSSQKGQENGDPSNNSERPLKKARFAWQVKGKYHLKNDGNDTIKTTSTSDPVKAESSGSANSGNSRDTEKNLISLDDNKQDLKTLDCVTSAPQESLTSRASSNTDENLRCINSCEQMKHNNTLRGEIGEGSCARIRPLPVGSEDSTSLTEISSIAEDQCIARWQTKQMVKTFVDNTINRVLDLWIHVPQRPEDEQSRSVMLDVADFVNNLPGDNTIENEGILMAITTHGLQQPGSSKSSNIVDDSNSDTENVNPLTPSPYENESRESVVVNTLRYDVPTSSNNLDIAWYEQAISKSLEYSDQLNEGRDMTVLALFPESSNSSSTTVDENPQNSSTECDGHDNPVINHSDFLDEAILFAIQSNGLTTIGSDYG